MTYEVRRVSTDGESPIGRYETFDAALAARDRDVVDQAVANRGGEFAHVIVGPGRDGPLTRHSAVTHVDPKPNPAGIEEEVDGEELLAWLEAVHAV